MTVAASRKQARSATEAAFHSMPMVCKLVGNLKSSGFTFPSNAMVFGVQHLMAQSLGLCWALATLGLAYDRIALVGKAYSTCPESRAHLETLGVMVNVDRRYDMRRSQSEELVEDVHVLARRFDARRSSIVNPSVLVLDDGGQTLTRVQNFLPTPILLAGVEQTASGFWQTGIRSVPVPIVDVGSSAVKRLCEPAIVVEAALRRVRERLAGQPRGIAVGIVGLGFIGLSLAKALDAEGYRLRVHDSRPDAYHQFGDARRRRIYEVIDESDVIFGCTGTDVTRDLLQEFHERGLSRRHRELLSMSSGDDEFFSLKAALLRDAGSAGYGVSDISDVVGEMAGSTFCIARNAFPINFDNSAESVPLRWIQGTICALIAALAQAQMIQRPAGHSHPIKRIMLDMDFQEWLLRHWMHELSDAPTPTGGTFGPPPSRAVLEQLSRIRTDPGCEPVPPVFGPWTTLNQRH